MMISTRLLNKQDVNELVDIHIEAFSDFFLTSLGRSFLEVYYKSLIKHREGVAVCAVNESSEMVGFCVGTISSVGFHKRLIISNIIQFGIQFAIILFKNPRSILRLISNMEKVPVKQIDGNVAELLSVGVRKSVVGTGAGGALVQRFEDELKSKKSMVVTLTTDFDKNERAIGFYRKIGYEIYTEFIAFPDRKMYKMIKYLQ